MSAKTDRTYRPLGVPENQGYTLEHSGLFISQSRDKQGWYFTPQEFRQLALMILEYADDLERNGDDCR